MSVQKLFSACKSGVFPDLDTLTKYGLDNHNPVEILKIYQTAIVHDGITEDDFERYFKDGKLNTLLFERCDSVKSLKNYETILQKGGIHTSEKFPQRECKTCQFCAVHKDLCDNCNKCPI